MVSTDKCARSCTGSCTLGRAHSCCAGVQFQHVQGQLVNLLRVAVEDSMDIGLRQIAAITFKNLVRKDWDPSGGARATRSQLAPSCPPACSAC